MAESPISTDSGTAPVPASRRTASKSTSAKPKAKAPAVKAEATDAAEPATKPTPVRKPARARSGTAKSTAAKPATKASPAKPTASRARAQTATPAASAETDKPVPAIEAKAADLARTAPKSKDTSATAKEHAEHVKRIWDLAKRIGICMFVTWDGERQRARPLAATVEEDQGAIFFLTDVAGEKDDQIERFPIVTLAFADHGHSKYVAITGKATVSNDRQRIKDLWSPFAKAWWDSPDDPNIRLVKVVPQDAELWDSPGRIVSTISMLAAAITRRSPKIGENAKVAF